MTRSKGATIYEPVEQPIYHSQSWHVWKNSCNFKPDLAQGGGGLLCSHWLLSMVRYPICVTIDVEEKKCRTTSRPLSPYLGRTDARKRSKKRVASPYHATLSIIPDAALHRLISRGLGIFISPSISLASVLRHHSARRYRLLLQSSHSHMALLTAHYYAANETPTSVRWHSTNHSRDNYKESSASPENDDSRKYAPLLK